MELKQTKTKAKICTLVYIIAVSLLIRVLNSNEKRLGSENTFAPFITLFIVIFGIKLIINYIIFCFGKDITLHKVTQYSSKFLYQRRIRVGQYKCDAYYVELKEIGQFLLWRIDHKAIYKMLIEFNNLGQR